MEMICIAKCTAIHKKSKAQGFGTLEVGDINAAINILNEGLRKRTAGTVGIA